LLGPAQKQTSVIAGDAKRETFDFRVIAPVKDGKQRITARGSDDNDAIEKPVSVHPDGEELSVTAGDVLDDGTSIELEIAQGMIPNSSRGELKIYPSLLAHVVEGVEAIMQRPYGCGEQTISSTYPSLLLLRHYKKSGEGFPLRARAQRYLNDGYSRLLNYRAENGGFTYWGYGEPDLALTAYALRFLVDAGDVTSVDQDVVKQARDWLVKQQRPDGSWRSPHWKEGDAPGPSVAYRVCRPCSRANRLGDFGAVETRPGFSRSRVSANRRTLLTCFVCVSCSGFKGGCARKARARETSHARSERRKHQLLGTRNEHTLPWLGTRRTHRDNGARNPGTR